MSQKDMKYSVLLDYYGELLSENQRTVMDLYYNEDFSLSEIADEVCITRQGVHDALNRAEGALDEYEYQLGLHRSQEKKLAIAKKFKNLRGELKECCKEIKGVGSLKVGELFELFDVLVDDLENL